MKTWLINNQLCFLDLFESFDWWALAFYDFDAPLINCDVGDILKFLTDILFSVILFD